MADRISFKVDFERNAKVDRKLVEEIRRMREELHRYGIKEKRGAYRLAPALGVDPPEGCGPPVIARKQLR